MIKVASFQIERSSKAYARDKARFPCTYRACAENQATSKTQQTSNRASTERS